MLGYMTEDETYEFIGPLPNIPDRSRRSFDTVVAIARDRRADALADIRDYGETLVSSSALARSVGFYRAEAARRISGAPRNCKIMLVAESCRPPERAGSVFAKSATRAYRKSTQHVIVGVEWTGSK